MNTFTRIFFLLIVAGSILGCSRKKNNFLSRNWHALTTQYNTLYNGNMALEAGREELNQNYADNYWDILPVERLQVDENITLPDSIRNQNFGYAEEKAVKAIQRHSMLIEGKERNPQIDEAYLLLGKARYFDQRFIPALEAFNYILHKYPASDNINHAQVWREKTNMRLDNNKLAIKNLKRILEHEELDDQDLADANATLAQAYISLQELDSAVAPLKVAAEFTKKNQEKGRYHFIVGQLYNRLNRTREANMAFDEVIDLNRRSPRVYMINAYVQKARNFEYGEGEDHRLREMLRELEADRENRPFLDKIYFQIGEYYNKRDSTARAVEYYNKSLRAPSSDIYLRSVNYEILANMNFNKARYREAAKYYDSTLAEMSPRLKEFRSIKKKRDNLEDVIQYQEIAEKTDSILSIANLDQEEQIAHFTKYTDSLQNALSDQISSGNIGLETAQPTRPATGVPGPPAAGEGSTGNFYFYNPSRVNGGAREFVRQWGNRQLADNWRWEETRTQGSETGEEEVIAGISENDPRFDPMTYLHQIPTDETVLDSLNAERNFAYYQLGLIYKEKYEEHEMAIEKLEALLQNSPEERLVLPAKFHLYQLYEEMGNHILKEKIKEDILTNYPDSRYAAFIENPESLLRDENSPEAIYEEVYQKFENGDYNEVLAETSQNIMQFSGDEIVPKFELLKAMAAGRLLGIEAYKSALNHVALNYPQSPEGKRAQEIFNKSIPELEQLSFNRNNDQGKYKLIYSFDVSDKEQASQLLEKVKEAITDVENEGLSVSLDIYNPDQVFVVVHGLKNENRALGFAELLEINEDYQVEKEAIAISAENYRVIQLHKNLDTYLKAE